MVLLPLTSTPTCRLAFQPVLDLHDGRVEYLETYLRLPLQDHRARRLAAESDGSIVDLDRAVLAQALPLMQRGHRLALNVSPHTVLGLHREFTQPLLALPEASRPIIEINDPYLLNPYELGRLAGLLQGLPVGLNHYQGTTFEDEVLTTLQPAWVKLDSTSLDSYFAGLGCNALQQALSTCNRLAVRLVITRIETAGQLAHVRNLCGIRWGQGRLLAQETDGADYPAFLPLPQTVEIHPPQQFMPSAEGCWHCLYSRLSGEQDLPVHPITASA